MKAVLVTDFVEVPEDVKVKLHARQIVVSGPRGELSRDLRHASIDIKIIEDGKRIQFDMWHPKSKVKASMNSVCSAVRNLIVGVTRGFRYKMRFVYAHFPINVSVSDGGKTVEVRNFLGEKRIRIVKMLDGVTCYRSADVKDELVLEGNDIQNVSQSAALVHQCSLVKRKDIRKFLDGIYVSEKGHIVALE